MTKKTRSPTGQVAESDRDDAREALRQFEEQERIHAEQVAHATQSPPNQQGA